MVELQQHRLGALRTLQTGRAAWTVEAHISMSLKAAGGVPKRLVGNGCEE